MTALPIEAPYTGRANPEPVLQHRQDPLQPATACVTATRESSRACTLDLSRLRTHHTALDILKAYKLSGNFHINLQVVLNHMGLSEMVAHQIVPHSVFSFSDCRKVIFSCDENIPGDRFNEIMESIKAGIGFDMSIGSSRRTNSQAGSR